jgi:hypothetical protein
VASFIGARIEGGEERMEKKQKWILLIAVLAMVIVGAVAGGALLLNNHTQLVKNGDYVCYSVTMTNSYEGPKSGYFNITFSNVTLTSYDMKLEYIGLDLPSESKHMKGIGVLTTLGDLGTKGGHSNISTPYGIKSVDAYLKYTDNQTWTSYAGANPLVQYQIFVTIGSSTTIFQLYSTNIEQVKTGNSK